MAKSASNAINLQEGCPEGYIHQCGVVRVLKLRTFELGLNPFQLLGHTTVPSGFIDSGCRKTAGSSHC